MSSEIDRSNSASGVRDRIQVDPRMIELMGPMKYAELLLCKAGYHYKEVASEVGVHHSTIRTWARRHDWPLNPHFIGNQSERLLGRYRMMTRVHKHPHPVALDLLARAFDSAPSRIDRFLKEQGAA